MLYTLAKFFVWGLGFAVIGGVIGWLLRSLRCAREVAHAKAVTVDLDEVERLRHRVANLEPVVADRDALRVRLGDLEREARSSRVAVLDAPAADPEPAAPVAAAPAVHGFAALAAVVPDHDPEAARAVMGAKVDRDDLKVVEGIGPVLDGILRAAGITTWWELAATTPEQIREVLVAADDRHRLHDPTTWPRQARLAALGEWEALKSLQDRLSAGRN